MNRLTNMFREVNIIMEDEQMEYEHMEDKQMEDEVNIIMEDE